MAEQRKRLSKKASKILFEIICEESFEGKSIKSLLPATRRISKVREGLWEYIRSQLALRSDEEYDLGTVSAAWYYNLRKIGSCLDQIDLTEDNGLTIDKLRTMERYVCNNMGDRIRGRGKGKGGRGEEARDVKLTAEQMINLSRQTTMDVSSNYSLQSAPGTAHVGRGVTLNGLSVKNEMGSSNEDKETNKGNAPREADEREDANGDNEMREDEGMNNDLNDLRDLNETSTIEDNHGIPFDTPGDNDVPMDGTPLSSRYNTVDTTLISRNNSTMSVSGYDADNEKGLIKRRRKELKTRAERDKVVKEEEEENEKEEQTEEDANDGIVEDEGEDEVENEENEGEDNADKSEEKLKMIANLKGMIANLRDHIVSLRIMGSIDAIDMENLADSFENASKSINNNVNAV